MRREYAEMLIARGVDDDRVRAGELLRQTLREAEAGGMSQLISRVQLRLAELERRGGDDAPVDDGQPDRVVRELLGRRSIGSSARPGEVGAHAHADAPALAPRRRPRRRAPVV